MRKILTLVGIAVFATGISFASIDEDKTTDIDVLRAQGYSESALQIVDVVKANNQGPNGTYQRRFSPKKASPYQALKIYVDPIQDDGAFAEHQVNFTNTWQGDETEYSMIRKETENL